MTSLVIVHLLSHVDVGHIILIKGLIEEESKTFKIQLLNNCENSNDRKFPLQIEADIIKKKIILSSFHNDSNENCEEQIYNIELITDDLSFKFYILTLEENFRIALNDEHLCNYKHHSNAGIVKLIKITGDFDCIKQVDHRKIYPFCWPPNQEELPTIAFSCDVPCHFSQNTIIILKIAFSGDEKGSFFIRFNERGTKKQLFHFNPRFAEKEIVCNSMNDRLEWQAETRYPNFPFELNKEYQLCILMDVSYFQIAVNGHHILKYPFKTVKSTLLRASKNHSIYDKLTGFKIFALNGLKLKVTYVDFFNIKENDSKFYEIFSNLNFISN
ncbi:hypothetical protein PVAND_010190 [Polypedilum vanderplanki]|uniref:Galectin n=1 Tax=Polypedilum vanderplanki TaxID=319348 RepID=A0A9J6CFY2_POLVA|nr:hypothetical protein PVAND_010190 [Polypedilum vanderplanki]